MYYGRYIQTCCGLNLSHKYPLHETATDAAHVYFPGVECSRLSPNLEDVGNGECGRVLESACGRLYCELLYYLTSTAGDVTRVQNAKSYRAGGSQFCGTNTTVFLLPFGAACRHSMNY